MITGNDYMFYSDKSPIDIETKFIALLKKNWKTPIIEEFERTDNQLELFFAKDDKMNKKFSHTGYTLNQHKEGCFMLCASRFEQLETKVRILNIILPKEREKTNGYDTLFFLKNVWEYTLVLPSEINDSKFSNEIYNFLWSLLK